MMSRLPREQDTREETSRIEEWNPASLLPTPEPMDGWRFKWVRKSILGDTDVMNMSVRNREGWAPVNIEEQPSLALGSESREFVEIGGLILCKLPEARANARERYFANKAEAQLTGLSAQYQNDAGADSRMPLVQERKTKVSRSPQD